MLNEVLNHVFEVETYKELDYAFVNEFFKNGFDLSGGCSAVVKTLADGTTIMGRNMDLNISRKPAYIVRTDVENHYKTVGLAYIFTKEAPDYEEVKSNGIPEMFRKGLPFITTDVLNEKGLYIEINMRMSECWPNGEPKFVCTGTNPDAKDRIFVTMLGRYVGENCASVDEAIEYVKTLDIFTGLDTHAWNFCYLMADKSGHYGLLEIAQNKVIWHDYQNAQTNFYIDKELSKQQLYKAGVGRYEYITKHIDSVTTKEEMYKLMKDISYFQMYENNGCPYDVRSEFVANKPHFTYEYLMDENNKEEFEETMKDIQSRVLGKPRSFVEGRAKNWESTFTIVTDCNNKEMFVRFFEDDERTITLKVE